MWRFAAAFALILCTTPAAAEPAVWRVDMAESRLGFTALWQNAPVKGAFKTWRADIRFDPDDLAESRVTVEVETGSADTAYAERDAEIKKPDWFAIEAFPTATFAADVFRRVDGASFEADGLLSIKGVEQPVTLPFTLEIDGDAAVMTATIPLSRLAFKIGEGQWRDTAFIKETVTVEIEVRAKREE